MTIKEVIGLTDSLTPNTIDEPVKVKWLSDLEHTIYLDIHQTHEGTDKMTFAGFNADTPLDTELSVAAPYDEIYRWYLEMKICEVTGELTRYNNANAKYHSAIIAYMDFINRNYTPKGLRNIKLL